MSMNLQLTRLARWQLHAENIMVALGGLVLHVHKLPPQVLTNVFR